MVGREGNLKDNLLVIILISVMLIAGVLSASNVNLAKAQNGHGPRTRYLLIKYGIPDPYQALKNGEIDIMLEPLTSTQYADAVTNTNIIVEPVVANDMIEFDINSNETISTYPGIISPTSQPDFRRALTCLINKTDIINGIWGGFAERMDMPIIRNAPSWINESCEYPYFDWEYNVLKAKALLDAAGFVQGSTPNPDYNPNVPWSDPYIRVYPETVIVHDNPHVCTDIPPVNGEYNWTLMLPATEILRVMGLPEGEHWYKPLKYTFNPATNTISVNVTEQGLPPLQECSYLWIEYKTPHPKAGQDLDPIIFIVRNDRPLRVEAAEYLAERMRLIGIPVTFQTLSPLECYIRVWEDRNYHLYTGAWILPRFPAEYLYFIYHSQYWKPWSYNYIIPPCSRPRPGISAMDPNLDIALEDMYYASSMDESIQACHKFQGLFEKYMPNIPLLSTKSFYAYRSWLLAVTDVMGYGPVNTYTFLKAYKCASAPQPDTIRAGTFFVPDSFNILFAQWIYDYYALDRLWESGQTFNPYDLGRDQPWFVQDWAVCSWLDNGQEKVKVTYWIRKDITWVAPITGEPVYGFTVKDIIFSDMFIYAFPDSWHYNQVADISYIQIVDDYCFEIYYNSRRYFAQYEGNYPYLPKDIWLPLFCELVSYTVSTTATHIILPGKVAYVENVTVNGALVNYKIGFNSTAQSANLIVLKELPPVQDPYQITVYYWNITGDPHGYFPGSDTDWQTTTYSIGPYTLVEYVKGDYALFEKNYYYFLETPPLGEIDWFWWWGDRDSSRPAPQHPEGPRTGNFIIDIYDVIYVCASYGTQAYLELDPNYCSGADIAPSYSPAVPYGGLIDIYDAIAMLVEYGTEWGCTPLDP